MLEFITANLSTILVAAVVFGLTGLSLRATIRSMRSGKRSGCSSCGGHCSGSCHGCGH